MKNVPKTRQQQTALAPVAAVSGNAKERELVRQCQEGTADAFEELIDAISSAFLP